MDYLGGGWSLHQLPRVAAGASAAVAAVGVRCANPAATIVGCVGVALSGVGEYVVQRTFPILPIRRFGDLASLVANKTPEGKKLRQKHVYSTAEAHELAALQRFHVGMQTIEGEHGTRPHATIFYPTDEAPDDSTAHPSYIPFGDLRYANGFAEYGRVPPIVSRHHMAIRMVMRRNARLASEVRGTTADDCRLGTKEFPIVIFSHGLAGHQHMYAAYAADLAAMGATVISLQHCDGSACFALEPPAPSASDARRAGCVSPPSQHTPVPYAQPPAGDEELFRFRRDQILERRVPEIWHIMQYIASGRLHQTLGCDANALRSTFGHSAAAPATPSQGGGFMGKLRGRKTDHAAHTLASRLQIPITLIGHSFGAATALAATVVHNQPSAPRASDQSDAARGLDPGELRRTFKIAATVALDTWGMPVNPWVADVVRDAASSGDPSKAKTALLLQDSEHWERWTENKEQLSSLLDAWKANINPDSQRAHMPGTDHLTLSVMSDLAYAKRVRRRYTIIDRDRIHVARWAADGLDFIKRCGDWSE